MATAKVNAVRNVDFGVTDLEKSKKFYTEVWGLAVAEERPGSVYLRGTGAFHHIVALHQRPKSELLRVTMTAASKEAVDALASQVREAGATEIEAPAAINEPGGGYGFTFRDPEGRNMRIVTGDARHGDTADDANRPRKVSHTVLNSKRQAELVAFYEKALGFKVSDRTRAMTFIRCNEDHHSIALVQSDHVTLHHIAFEMQEPDSVMRGAGRMRDNGYPIGWGVGRHGPGNNVFAYFVSPDSMVIEYTADVEHVDDSYVAHGPEYWTWPAGRTDQWGIAIGPTDAMKAAEKAITFPAEIFHPAA